jgi:hypothetical protein
MRHFLTFRQEPHMRSMRRLGAAAAVALFLVAPGASAQGDFEGVIAYDVSMAGMQMQITQMVKGKLIRQEMQGPMGQMVNLTDTESMVMTTLMPAQKMYMRMDLKAMADQMAAQSGMQTPPQPKPEDFKPTGQKETIAGHACEHYSYAQDDINLDICIAQGLGFVPMMSAGMNQGAAAQADIAEWKKRFPNGFLPLGMNVTAQGQTMTMRATNIEKKSIADDLFKVPAGYTAMPGSTGD